MLGGWLKRRFDREAPEQVTSDDWWSEDQWSDPSDQSNEERPSDEPSDESSDESSDEPNDELPNERSDFLESQWS